VEEGGRWCSLTLFVDGSGPASPAPPVAPAGITSSPGEEHSRAGGVAETGDSVWDQGPGTPEVGGCLRRLCPTFDDYPRIHVQSDARGGTG
jgi:hypothetical protein